MDNKIYDATFIIIAVISSLIYVLIYFSLRRQQRDISQQSRSRNRALQEEFVKTIMIVVFIQIFTLVPTSGYWLIHGRSDDSPVVNVIFFEIYLINSAINPFQYIWRLKNYRETFRLILCRKLR
jgi:heme/copper-type cytochrome/quinol oxidase subunit 2